MFGGAYVVSFKIKDLKVLAEANVEQLFDVVKTDVKLFELGECLNSLELLQFTSCQVQDPHVLEGGANVSERPNYGVIEFEVLKRG